MKGPWHLSFAAALAALASFAATSSGAARAADAKKVQLNPQPEPPGVTAAEISTVSPGVVKAGPPAITKVDPSTSPVAPGVSVKFLVEGTGDCKRGRIEFGDGKSGNEYALVGGKGQPAPVHTYAKVGTYDVKVYGLADSWAKVPAPPPPSQHACAGHATTQVVVKRVR